MPSAKKDGDCLSDNILTRVEKVILGFYSNPRPHGVKKLSGGGSRWRIRVGDYRILYEINDSKKLVRIYRIAHRKDVYK